MMRAWSSRGVGIALAPALIFVLAPVSGGAAEPKAPAKVAPVPLMGGWSSVGVKDAALVDAARAAVRLLDRPNANLRRIVSARQQVVAGMNYRLELILTDRTRWRVTIWRMLDGNYALTASERR
jgi:hypothetical protein